MIKDYDYVSREGWEAINEERNKMKKRKGKVFKGSVLKQLDELEAELAEAKAMGDADWIQDTELEIEELLEKGKTEDT